MKLKIKATGEIGYVAAEYEDNMVCLRVPSDNNWPFPVYVYVNRKDCSLVHKKEDLSDIPEALY